MKNEYVDTNYMTNIIKDMDSDQQRLYMNLYKIYNLLNKNYNLKEQRVNSLDPIELSAKRKINEQEDRIYTINDKQLTQKERITLELKNILRYINKNGERISSSTKKRVLDELNELNTISKRNENNMTNQDMINYFKKRISILQAYLGMNIKFFNAALEVFDEQILMSKINSKTR